MNTNPTTIPGDAGSIADDNSALGVDRARGSGPDADALGVLRHLPRAEPRDPEPDPAQAEATVNEARGQAQALLEDSQNRAQRQLNEANLRRVRSVEKERDEARSQMLNLRKERLMERLFLEAEGRVGGDERGTFFDTFVTLCGSHFQLAEVDGRERLLPVDGKGQPLTADGVALSDGDYMEELRRHPVYSFLFQQRSGLYSAAVPESGHEHGGAVNLQTLSTAELYLEAVKGTTPRAAAPRR